MNITIPLKENIKLCMFLELVSFKRLSSNGNFLQFKGIIDCFRNIGISDACIESFTKKSSSKDKYKNFLKEPNMPSRDCMEWQVQDKGGKKAKMCVALAKRSGIAKRSGCAQWIRERCSYCFLSGPFMIICFPICHAGYGC